jgi:hypothetical protein
VDELPKVKGFSVVAVGLAPKEKTPAPCFGSLAAGGAADDDAAPPPNTKVEVAGADGFEGAGTAALATVASDAAGAPKRNAPDDSDEDLTSDIFGIPNAGPALAGSVTAEPAVEKAPESVGFADGILNPMLAEFEPAPETFALSSPLSGSGVPKVKPCEDIEAVPDWPSAGVEADSPKVDLACGVAPNVNPPAPMLPAGTGVSVVSPEDGFGDVNEDAKGDAAAEVAAAEVPAEKEEKEEVDDDDDDDDDDDGGGCADEEEDSGASSRGASQAAHLVRLSGFLA